MKNNICHKIQYTPFAAAYIAFVMPGVGVECVAFLNNFSKLNNIHKIKDYKYSHLFCFDCSKDKKKTVVATNAITKQ